MRLSLTVAAVLALALPMLPPPAQAAGTLRFGLDFDLDTFDPARSGSYIERAVNASLCDQLLNIDPGLNIVPELATAWEWGADKLSLTLHLRPGVLFQDGAALDAEAVRANLVRSATAPFSARKSELAPVDGIDVIDPLTVRIRLKRPYAPLLALLANRSGTMLSPRILDQTPEQVAAHPVCAGPFAFVERVAQDHITLQRFPGYWNAQAVTLDRIEFRIITDSSIRRVNLQSGQLDVVNRLAATDIAAVQADPKLRVAQSPSLGFEMLSFNLSRGAGGATPFARDVRLRRALAMSLDLEGLNSVLFEGRFLPGTQTEPTGTRYWDPAYPLPKRDLAGARKLLAEAGQPSPELRLSVVNNPVDVQLGEVIQAMAGEAGFRITLNKGEAVSQTEAATSGDYQAYAVIWSGRPDPDGNLGIWMRCGAPLNWTGWCSKELDAALDKAAAQLDPEARAAAYHEVNALWRAELPYLPLYHFTWFWGLSDRVTGFVPRPDGLVRPVGIGLQP